MESGETVHAQNAKPGPTDKQTETGRYKERRNEKTTCTHTTEP